MNTIEPYCPIAVCSVYILMWNHWASQFYCFFVFRQRHDLQLDFNCVCCFVVEITEQTFYFFCFLHQQCHLWIQPLESTGRPHAMAQVRHANRRFFVVCLLIWLFLFVLVSFDFLSLFRLLGPWHMFPLKVSKWARTKANVKQKRWAYAGLASQHFDACQMYAQGPGPGPGPEQSPDCDLGDTLALLAATCDIDQNVVKESRGNIDIDKNVVTLFWGTIKIDQVDVTVFRGKIQIDQIDQNLVTVICRKCDIDQSSITQAVAQGNGASTLTKRSLRHNFQKRKCW